MNSHTENEDNIDVAAPVKIFLNTMIWLSE